MIPLNVVLALLILHFIADFCFQSDWMAINKSKNWKALLTHTAIYSASFFWFGLEFVGVTFLLHTLTDAITSRITSKLWFSEDHGEGASGFRLTEWHMARRHWFFVVIGLDQLIHYGTLLWTTQLLSSY